MGRKLLALNQNCIVPLYSYSLRFIFEIRAIKRKAVFIRSM